MGRGRPDWLGLTSKPAGVRLWRLYGGAFDQIDIFHGDAYIPATTYKGWFLGSGYEYGLGFMPGLFWKTEYRFADYQAQTVPIVYTDGFADSFDSHKYVQTIR